MKHSSVIKPGSPIEFITTESISPFISKCLIKVCYVGDEPNRNRSIITKDVARAMAPSLRGCPIVGFFNETKKDFEQHNQMIQQIDGEWRLTSMTKPYGFVDVNAKVWFQSYIDDGAIEREYLCTEGYIWDHAYPEAKRIKENGNNQSMELDENTLNAFWSKDQNGKPEFFIINEALLSKLCILGDDNEPCFEGSQITAFNLSFEDEFKQQLFEMMNQLKEILQEGGTTKVFTTYAVEIGDTLWSALYRYIEETYPDGENRWCSKYSLDGVFEEAGQKFAILCHRADMKYYRLNFSISDSDGFHAEDALIEVTKNYTPAETPQFAAEKVEAYVSEYVAKKEEDEKKKAEEDKKGQKDNPENKDPSEEDNSEDENKKKKKNYSAEYLALCPKCGKVLAECTCEKQEPTEYNLEKDPIYIELQNKFTQLSSTAEQLNKTIEELNKEVTYLREFKLNAERKDKEEMIARFYMLSEEDKKDVLDNIDQYSLDDIEAKLSVICVRNKVSFAEENLQKEPTVYNFNGDETDNATPAWVKAALNVAKSLNN